MEHHSGPPLKKCCFQMESDLEDRISTLPDEVLALIICDLKLREAGRMSVLSRRWRYMWTYITGILDFEGPVFKYEAARRRFIDWVNLVLDRHQGGTIDEFRVCYNLYERNSDVINSWTRFALERNVKRLVLKLRNVITTIDQDSAPPSFEDYALSFEDYALSFEDYALTRQVFNNSSASLTVLHLDGVKVTGEVLGYVLSRFPRLQVLDVKFSRSLVELKIAGPFPSLKHLGIVNCNSLRFLEVHAINLVSFTFHGSMLRVFLMEVPHLLEANIGGTCFLYANLRRFSSYCSCLEALLLDFTTFGGTAVFYKLPKFEKLKRLELSFPKFNVGDYIVCCRKVLRAYPLLQKLVLKIYGIKKKEESWRKQQSRHMRYQHDQLKVVEFVGFSGHKKYVELIQCFVDKLPRLEKVIVVPRLDPGRDIYNSQHELQSLLRPGLEFVIASDQNTDQ